MRDGGRKQETSVWAVILKEALVKLLGPYVSRELVLGAPMELAAIVT